MASTGSSFPDFDLYQELEVDPRASTETIEAAWRSLVKRFHPDIAPQRHGADDRIRRLNVAHDWLTNADLRAQYDAVTSSRFRPSRSPAGRSANPQRGAPAALGPVKMIHEEPAKRLVLRVVGYYALCVLSIIAAYVGSVIAALVIRFANIAAVVAAFLGEDAALSIIQLLDNILFAVLAAYLMSKSFKSALRPRASDTPLVALGTAVVMAMTFGFPTFASSYMPGLASWIVTDGAGLPAVLVLSLLEALVAGSAIAALGLVQRRELESP